MFASLIAIMAAGAVATSDAPTSSDQTASPSPASQAAADDSQKVVCHSEAVTGSRFEKRVCHTKAEWQRLTEQKERLMREINDRAAMVQAPSANMPGQ